MKIEIMKSSVDFYCFPCITMARQHCKVKTSYRLFSNSKTRDPKRKKKNYIIDVKIYHQQMKLKKKPKSFPN
jgi:hypothetical protein